MSSSAERAKALELAIATRPKEGGTIDGLFTVAKEFEAYIATDRPANAIEIHDVNIETRDNSVKGQMAFISVVEQVAQCAECGAVHHVSVLYDHAFVLADTVVKVKKPVDETKCARCGYRSDHFRHDPNAIDKGGHVFEMRKG